MTQRDIANAVGEYAQAAGHAWAAGFDGVEIHAANGYLIEQFIRDGSNHRTDAYGGSVQKRLRFLLEVTEAVAQRVPVDRIGVRFSPTSRAGEADLIAYGRYFLANPDLVERFRRGAPLNQPDTSTFYTDGSKGYTDYVPLDS